MLDDDGIPDVTPKSQYHIDALREDWCEPVVTDKQGIPLSIDPSVFTVLKSTPIGPKDSP